MKTLRPVTNKPEYWESLESEILKTFLKDIYLPLLKILRQPRLVLNSIDDVMTAIQSGHIRYADGGFQGVFHAAVSKELKALGAVWSKRQVKWMIPLHALPDYLQLTLKDQEKKDSELKETVVDKLQHLNEPSFNATRHFNMVYRRFDRDFRQSVRSITIAPKLTKAVKQQLSSEYSSNLDLYIKDFTAQAVKDLRKQVEEQTFKGNRYEDLAQTLQTSYGVAKRKAKFLARQETNLLTAKFRELRYRDIGISSYEWVAVTGTSEHPTRPYHKKLSGTVQKFSEPPITDPDGRRNNPGEDFGCRCSARPILKFK